MTMASPIPRLALGAPLALLVTIALAMLMQALIAQKVVIGGAPVPIPDFRITSGIEDTAPRVRTPPEKPADVAPPPPVPIGPVEKGTLGDGIPPLPIDQPEVDPAGRETLVIEITTPVQLIFAPRLEYPQRMYPREGSCTVAFDVTASGGTSNVRALSCTDNGFARSAESMVSRFQYRPAQGKDGAVESLGHSVVMEFKVEQ